MIHDLRLFLWLRYRLWVGSMRRALSSGPLASFGVSLSAVVGVLAFLFLLVVAVALLGASVAWSRTISDPDPTIAGPSVLLLRIGLTVLLALIVVLPASRAGTGAFGLTRSGMTRVLLAPLRRRHLHTLESFSHAFDPLILVTAPALLLLGFLVGKAGGAVGVLASLLLSATMIALLVVFSGLVGIGLQVILGNRRHAETMMLITLLVITVGSVVPALIQERDLPAFDQTAVVEPGIEGSSTGDAADAAADQVTIQTVPSAFTSFPWWLQWLPSESYARAMVLLGGGRLVAAVPSMSWLAFCSALCWVLSRRLWLRLVASPGTSSSGGTNQTVEIRSGAVLGLSLQTTAVAVATARSFLRTVRGKLALILTPILVVVVGVALDVGERSAGVAGEGGMVAALLGGRSSMLASIAISMGVLNLLPVLANVFGADREGFIRQALVPISPRQWILGKSSGLLLLYAAALLPALAVVAVWTGFSLAALGEALLRAGATMAWMIPVGLWISILFPRAVDLNSLGKQGNPHTLAQFFSFLALAVVLLGGSLASVAAEILIGGAAGRSLGAGLFLCLAVGVAVPLLWGAASLLEDRKTALVALTKL